jgi:hypothetical protein
MDELNKRASRNDQQRTARLGQFALQFGGTCTKASWGMASSILLLVCKAFPALNSSGR